MEQNHESITKRILHLNTLLTRSVSDSKTDSGSFLLSRETLVDALILLYDECNNEFLMKDPLIADFVEKYRGTILKLRDLNVGIGDFEVKKVISRGRFAEVVVAKEKSSQNICVLKKIRKSDILNVSERIYFENERNLLIAASSDNEARKWVPQLFYTFQNMKYLYYVLEFCPGGNLCTMLEYYKKNVPEPMLRFYLAEMIQAVHAVHSIGFVHRDIRPENVLVDKTGHLKLVDFGSSAKLSRHGQVNNKMVFSIPHYTAPEIFKFHESPSTKGYTAMCDWWSLGIVLYELICGTVPFTSDDVPKLYLSTSNYGRKLQYPKQVNASQDLKNIICGLLQPVEKRIGYEKLVNLDYFNDIAWACLRERDPPFVPSLTSPDDTSYFTTFEVQRPTPKVEDYKLQRRFTGRNLPFLGFTYLGSDSADLDDASSSASSYVISHFPATISERRKTENYPTCKDNNEYTTEIPRFSTGSFRDTQMHSECSDESYQSASVRLQNEVNQLHLFYNQKALIIEEKLKNKFHDMYNCITEDQSKLFLDRQLMRKEFKEKEDKLIKENENLKALNQSLENELDVFKNKCHELEVQQEVLNRNLEEAVEKLKKSEKLKKESIAKLNQEIQKLNKDLLERSDKLKEAEEKMLNLSNQQAAKLAMLSKTRTTLRSRSTERDKFEQENVSLKNQLTEANKKIAKLTQEFEKKGKVKLDLEFKMTATDKGESSDKSKGDFSRDKRTSQNSKEMEKSHQELEQRQKEIFELHEKLEKEKERNQKDITDLSQKLNRELDGKRREIAELQTKITENQDSKQKEISVLQDKMKNEKEQSQKEIAKLNEKLNQELECKRKEILALQAQLNQKQDCKQKEIGDLQNEMSKELQRKQKEISDLQEKLSQKQDRKQKEITDLQDKLDHEQKHKQKEITDLQEKLNREQRLKQKEITDLQNKLAQENKQIQKEIAELQDKLNQQQKRKHKEIADLQEKLNKELERKQKEIAELSDKLSQEQKRKQKEIAELQEKLEKQLNLKIKEISNLQEKLSQEQKLKQTEIARLQGELNKQLDSKQKQIADIEGKLVAMNDDLFNNLVTIEDLKTALEKKNNNVRKYEDEITSLRKQLEEKCELVSTVRMSLCKSDKEKEKLESKIEALLKEIKNSNEIKLKEIDAVKVDPNRVLKQFETTMREILRENQQKKENTIKTSDLENMFKTMQKRVSLVCTSAEATKGSSTLKSDNQKIVVLEAQIERLESQLKKQTEEAALHREAAKKAEDELEATKQKLSNLEIDLRFERRELKTAEEKIKTLQTSKSIYYRELKEEKENLSAQLKVEQEKMRELQTIVESLKKSLDSKEETIKKKEIELQDRMSRIVSLKEEMEKVKNEDNGLKKETKKLENDLKEKEIEIKQLKSKISKMKEEIKQNKSTCNSSKEEIESWKTKYEKLEKDAKSVRETCLMLDKAVEGYENHIEKMKEEFKEQSEKNSELNNEVDRLTDELKTAKKMVNEEKSLKIFAESKIRHLESDLEKGNEELKALEEDNEQKAEQIADLEDQIRQLEDFITTAKESMAKNSEYMHLLESDMISLKKDRSDYLTEIYQLKKEKKELINELDETKAEANDLRKANDELRSVFSQNQAYHEINHLKGDMTVQQLSKLVDFLLQNKCQDSTKQKRTLADKLFGTRGKENLNPKELENLLYIERAKCKDLTDQLYRARIELTMLRGEYSSKCSSPSPKILSDYESNLSRTTSSTKQLTSISNFSELEIPSRIKHNIPHKFETKRCTKTGCKCSVCNNVISFGHSLSYCKECHAWCHISCTKKSEPNCGLPKALMEQMAALNKCPVQATSSESSLKSEIEGNIRVLRDGKWEKMHICVESRSLMLYDRSPTSEQSAMKIPVSSIKTIVDNVDATSILTLTSSYDGEANCVLKIIYEEGKSQKSLYMRASTEDDKVNWLNVLKRNIIPKQITFKLEPQECFKGGVVCSFSQSDRLKVNQMLQISAEVCLIAADEGLYSLKVNMKSENTSSCKPVKLSGADKVSKIRILTKLRVAVLISGEENLLKKCDLRMLVSNAEAAECSAPFVTLDDASTGISLRNCVLLEASRCNSLISFSTDKHLMILEWKDCGFDVLKFKKKISEIKWLLFTPLNMFYGTNNECCRIELQNMNENRLNVFKCREETNSKSFHIEDMIKINSDLYLACDKSLGVFVDANGKRIKSAETMKWPLPLKRIVYNKPFLCVVHEYSVSLVYLPSTNESSEEKFKFSMIDFINPTVLGIVKQPTRGVYIKEEDEDRCDLFFLDPLIFMKRNPKQSWSSISTHSGQTTDEECIQKSLNISSETDISLNSSILESSSEH